MLKIWKIAIKPFALLFLGVWLFQGTPAFSSVYPFAITLKGPSELRGSRIEALSAYAKKAQKWQRVAMQIDEVNARGDYVLESGLPYTASSDDGIFDENDEVVVAGRDVGEAFTLKDVPVDYQKTAKKFWRVSVSTPKQEIGDILIVLHMSNQQEEVKSRGVEFDEKAQQITTDRYRYRFRPERAALLGQVEVKTAGAKEWREVFADSRFTLALKLPWYLPNFNIDDETFTSSIECWRVGPIRTIVAVGVKLKRFLALFNFHMFSELVFYENALEIPTVIEFTFDPNTYLKPGSGVAYGIDFAPELKWQVESNLAVLPKDGPKSPDKLSKSSASDAFFYAKAEIPEMEVFVKVRVDENATKNTPPPYLIRSDEFKDPDRLKSWNWLGDLTSDLGVFVDFSGVRKGSYEFGLDLILLTKADESTLADYKSVATKWSTLAIR